MDVNADVHRVLHCKLDAGTLTVQKNFNGNKYITTKYKYKYIKNVLKYKYKYQVPYL